MTCDLDLHFKAKNSFYHIVTGIELNHFFCKGRKGGGGGLMYDLILNCRFEIKFQCGLLLGVPNLKMRPTPLQPNVLREIKD